MRARIGRLNGQETKALKAIAASFIAWRGGARRVAVGIP